MLTNDHKALGEYLIKIVDSDKLSAHRKMFLLGCVEPDYNLLTYIRGSIKGKIFFGHNAANSMRHIHKCIRKIEQKGLHSAFDYFTLGTLVHYLSDSFTYPHNEHYTGTLAGHVEYEKKLHLYFTRMLACAAVPPAYDMTCSVGEYILQQHQNYENTPPACMSDCTHILRVCRVVLQQLTSEEAVLLKFRTPLNIRKMYGNTSHNKLV